MASSRGVWISLWLGAFLAFSISGCPGTDDDDDSSPVVDDDDDDDTTAADDDADPSDLDEDGYSVSEGDCDDGNPDVHPGAAEVCNGEDDDCDGLLGDDERDLDGDGVMVCDGDCDDADSAVHPGANEICDGVDNDCDGIPLEGEFDSDGDGYLVCAGDCNDDDPLAYPGAEEQCNGIDDNCNESVPAVEVDDDGDGYLVCDGDCDDANTAVYPGAEQACDGVEDNDCDGVIDDNDADVDGDGATLCDGDCDDLDGAVENLDVDGDGVDTCSGDCDDTDPAVYPDAAELCDGIDNDCDGSALDGEADDDSDGYRVCDGDCDDLDAAVSPGAAEACNGIDDDCDGAFHVDGELDGDGDGYLGCEECDDADAAANHDDVDSDGYSSCDGDCNDADPAVSPGATEVDGNAVDEDCDGVFGDPDWIDLLDTPDPYGDASGYLLDIEEFQFRFDGQNLQFRIESYTAFSDDDPDLTMVLFLADDYDDVYAIIWDNVTPDPDPLMLWEYDDGWFTSVTPPLSLTQDDDTGTSIVFSVDPADLGLGEEIYTAVGVDFYSAYADLAPDSGEFIPLCYSQDSGLGLDLFEIEDTVGGDGDGWAQPGETLEVTIDLRSACLGSTGPNLTGTLAAAPISSATVNLAVDTVTYNGGAAGGPMEPLPADDVFQIEIDPATPEGSYLLLELEVTDDLGNAWTVDVGYIGVEYPAQIPLTSVLTDPDDFSDPFDIAEVSYSTFADNLYVEIVSHDVRNADQEVDLYLDTDLDYVVDHIISTIDVDGGGLSGGVYEWDADDGTFEQLGSPSFFQFTAGTDFLLMEVPLADLGSPTFLMGYALAFDSTQSYADYAPDGLFEIADYLFMPVVYWPRILLADIVATEVTGDGDDHIEAGEEWAVGVELLNAGLSDAPQSLGTVSSQYPELVVTVHSGDAGPLPAGATVSTGSQWQFEVDAGALDSGMYHLDLAIDLGGVERNLDIPIQLGLVAGDTTADAPLLPAGGTYRGNTAYFADDYYDPTACTGYAAYSNDVVYALELTAGSLFVATVAYPDEDVDAVLYLSDSAVQPDVACVAGADSNLDGTETLVYSVPMTATYYLVVDGYYANEGGEYELQMSF